MSIFKGVVRCDEAIQNLAAALDCFVASLLAMTPKGIAV